MFIEKLEKYTNLYKMMRSKFLIEIVEKMASITDSLE